jgi:hypothetical protein
MTSHKVKSHNELGSKSVIIAKTKKIKNELLSTFQQNQKQLVNALVDGSLSTLLCSSMDIRISMVKLPSLGIRKQDQNTIMINFVSHLV